MKGLIKGLSCMIWVQQNSKKESAMYLFTIAYHNNKLTKLGEFFKFSTFIYR